MELAEYGRNPNTQSEFVPERELSDVLKEVKSAHASLIQVPSGGTKQQSDEALYNTVCVTFRIELNGQLRSTTVKLTDGLTGRNNG